MVTQQPSRQAANGNGQSTALAIPTQVAQQIQELPRFVREGESLDLTVFFQHPELFNTLVSHRVLQAVSPYHIMAPVLVKLNPDLTAGDVYKDGKNFRPAKNGLMKMSAGAGIQWVPQMCGIVGETEFTLTYQTVGFVVGPDGTPKPIKGTKRIDLKALEEESRLRYEDEAEKGRPEWVNGQLQHYAWKSEDEKARWIDRKVRGEIVQRRKNIVGLAETGAYLRAIRSILTVKSNYTQEELQKPFVMVRTFLDPRANPDAIKESILQTVTMRVETDSPASPMAAIAGMLQAGSVPVSEIEEAPDPDTEVYGGDVPEEEEEVDVGHLPGM